MYIWFFWLTIVLAPQVSAQQERRVDAATGAETWEAHRDGVAFSLTQILPDQVRAFYVNRGFQLEVAEHFAVACVFMAVLRNDAAPGTIHYVLQDWRVVHDGKTQPPRSVASWMDYWQQFDLGKGALVAFRWAQFPPEQEYEPGGDWNQGMLSTGLPSGSEFDITASWDVAGENYELMLKDVRCAI